MIVAQLADIPIWILIVGLVLFVGFTAAIVYLGRFFMTEQPPEFRRDDPQRGFEVRPPQDPPDRQ